MTTRELAARLVDALEHSCSGIRYDYDMKELESLFDSVLQTGTREMIHQQRLKY